MPLFVCDYCFLSSQVNSSSELPDNIAEKLTIFVVKEHNSKNTFATVVPHKGVSDEHSMHFFFRAIMECGYTFSPICIKSDQEPAIKAVIDKVREQRAAQTLIEESPIGSSASNGSIEAAIGQVEAQIRVIRLALENNFMVKIPVMHPVMPWLVAHACFLLNRFMIGHDGMSAYQRLRKKPFNKPIVELAETVYYKKN